MRVLFVTNSFPPAYTAGAEVSLYHTCRGLLRQGVNCSVVFLNNRMPVPCDEWYDLDGIPVHRVNFYSHWRPNWRDIFDWRIYRAMQRELHHLQPDIVHVHNVSGATLAPYVACRRADVPMVNTLHDSWLLCPNNMLFQQDGAFCDPVTYPHGCRRCFRKYDYWADVPYRRQLFAALTANVNLFIPPSQALIREHCRAGYDPDRFRLIRLGFALPTPEEPTHPEVRRLIGTTSELPTIVFAGGGTQTKGAKVVLQAIPPLLDRLKKFRLIVAGPGETQILQQFRHYEPAVEVIGLVPFKDMRALFAIADLTLFPSIWLENSPVVIFESFQVGTPVVATDFGGIPEFITEGETGYLFPMADSQALAHKISHHFDRPAVERRRMRHQCVAKVRTELTLENHLQSLQTVYDEVLAT